MKKYKFLLLGAALLIVAFWFMFSGNGMPSEGFINRVPLNLAGLDSPTKLNGSCIAEYYASPAGRDSRGQNYAIFMKLKENPKDAPDIAKVLNKKECEDEARSILNDVVQKLGIDNSRGVITSIYLNSSGKIVSEF